MQLASITPPTVPAEQLGVIRPGGPTAAPGPKVVGQAKVVLPMNFGLTALIDVSAGRRLGSFASLADAQRGVYQLAVGRPSVGIVRDGTSFAVTELLVPDFVSAPFTDDMWKQVRPTPLVVGEDPARYRSIESVRVLADRGDRPELLDVYTRGGGQRIVLG